MIQPCPIDVKGQLVLPPSREPAPPLGRPDTDRSSGSNRTPTGEAPSERSIAPVLQAESLPRRSVLRPRARPGRHLNAIGKALDDDRDLDHTRDEVDGVLKRHRHPGLWAFSTCSTPPGRLRS